LTIIGGFIFGMSSQTWGGKTLSRRNLDRWEETKKRWIYFSLVIKTTNVYFWFAGDTTSIGQLEGLAEMEVHATLLPRYKLVQLIDCDWGRLIRQSETILTRKDSEG
jgi:hypothetical protein